jgi:HSP20 family protein
MADQALAPAKPKQAATVFDQFLEPLSRLRTEVDRVFDDFPVRWPAANFTLGGLLPSPAVEMTETDKAYKVTVEVPGIPPENIHVEAEKGLLVVKGEKKEEREEKERDYTRSERSYGSFERRIALPADAELDEIHAKASDGVLKITIARDKAKAPSRRKIQIKHSKKD